MVARVHVHVRAFPDGRVLATPVDFPDLAVEAADRAAAVRILTSRLTKRLRRVSASMRSGLLDPPTPALERVEIEVVRGGKQSQERLRLTIGIVVLLRKTTASEVHLVRAPAVTGFEHVVADGAEAAAAAAKELPKYLRQWPLDALLGVDEVGQVSLETIELPLPAPAVATGAGEDYEGEDEILEMCGDDLTAQALEGRLSGLDRRDELVERVLAALASSGRSSVLLVGASEVGKTALVHELAVRLAQGEVPAALAGRELWRLPANELIAGARYTGMWQDRARRLVTRARVDDPILAMGDPGGIVDAGRWSESDNNLGRFLRTYLESGELTLVCECTPEQLAPVHKKEPSFIDAFYRVDVPEPTGEQAAEILLAAARRIHDRQGISFSPDALPGALELTRRFEPYRAFPGKAVRLLEESAQRDAGRGATQIAREDIVAAFAQRTGLPLALLSDEMRMSLADVQAHFEARVLGQPEATTGMVELVSVLKAGLNDPAKPLGSFLFVGPTGVGKTELAKALAEFLFGSRERVLRFDMGEHASADAVQRLLGAAWGGEREGELTRRVREQPFCVVLLDEIEKAHASVFDALLSALGEGRLTDAEGRTADFRNAIIIMTSNLGADARASRAVGFGSPDRDEVERLRRHYTEQAEKFFRPEFVNRLDRIVVFDPLEQATVRQIARREVGRLLLREGIVRRQLLVEIDERAIDTLAERGFDPQYGARPLQREIERAIIQPLAALIVEREPGPSDLARVHPSGDAIAVELEQVRLRERAESPRIRRTGAQEATLAKAATGVADLLERIEAEEATPAVTALRGEVEELISQTHGPTFWDEPVRARSTLTRVYRIERVLDGLEGLHRRASGLAEMARQMRLKRDRGRLGELRQAVEEIEDALLVARLELAGTVAASGVSDAALRVTPVGRKSGGWAAELLVMYAAWAERTGRDVREQEDPPSNSLVVEGLSSFDLLAGENGLHRRVLSDRQVLLARVTVTSANGDNGHAPEPADDPGTIVRIYEEGRRRSVRDPRTGTRVGNLDAVLREGRIDAFLLAYLRDSQDRRGGEPVERPVPSARNPDAG
jgi:ATP-dependent Clp protease ATP-binding subunit ClpC